MKDIAAVFSKNLRQRRKVLGLTQKAIAEKLSYSEKAVSKWENGYGLPPSCVLPDLAKILETSIDELMSPSDDIRYYLGIDGGGTKTEFVLADSDGSVLRRAVLSTSNPNDVGMTAACEILRAGILDVASEYNTGRISVFAGIAGAGIADNAEKISEFLSKFSFASVSCGTDVKNAVSVGLGKKNGIVVIMGTGSVVYAQSDGEHFRVGGYGYLIGDAGSGFAFGRDAIRAALQYEDGIAQNTLLHKLVAEQLGSSPVTDKLGELYTSGKRGIAKLAPLVFKAAVEGDGEAACVLNNNMEAVSDMIRGAALHLKENTVDVVLCGGLTAYRAQIVPLLKEKLKDDDRNYNISICDKPMVYGALYLAGMKNSEENEND
ncbi:MAG: XRE family transcriptional regulator [Clostridia bacterium]|nr:XRE family transcriptional regulator [Clostridia bacterium]